MKKLFTFAFLLGSSVCNAAMLHYEPPSSENWIKVTTSSEGDEDWWYREYVVNAPRFLSEYPIVWRERWLPYDLEFFNGGLSSGSPQMLLFIALTNDEAQQSELFVNIGPLPTVTVTSSATGSRAFPATVIGAPEPSGLVLIAMTAAALLAIRGKGRS